MVLRGLAILAGGFALLAIPGPEPKVAPAPDGGAPFVWGADSLWQRLDRQFVEATSTGCATILPGAQEEIAQPHGFDCRPGRGFHAPSDPFLDSLELRFFELAPPVAACPEGLPTYLALQQQLRQWVKDQSQGWDLSTTESRRRLYRLLYGSRAALEEVTLHHPGAVPALLHGVNEPSATPSAEVSGVRIHSGDMLVSRGGYPTSALIARGNDLPRWIFARGARPRGLGHRGGVHHRGAHRERGGDRHRRGIPARQEAPDPGPSTAGKPPGPPGGPAAAAPRRHRGDRARPSDEHIPYDFSMDYTDDSKLFCSEVASSVYRDAGLTLWTGLSTITAPGLRRWLASFGVKQFETQEPSDLEYDPQLVVVAEWRDTDALHADRIDNAVIDAMLEGAERGDALTFPWYQLPVIRRAEGLELGSGAVWREGAGTGGDVRPRGTAQPGVWRAAAADRRGGGGTGLGRWSGTVATRSPIGSSWSWPAP